MAALADIDRDLQAMKLGMRRSGLSSDQVRKFNERVMGQEITEISDEEWTDVRHQPKFVIGHKAIWINPREPYELHWPIRRGRFAWSLAKISKEQVLADLESLWAEAIKQRLGVDPKDLKLYYVIVIVPDSFTRGEIKEVMNVLLLRLRFTAAIVHQESMCATFGAGVGSACVIDVGDQKTSVCCVDEGLANPASRVLLNYGGCDVTRVFYELMKNVGFPYQTCDVSNRLDAFLLQRLKESHCCLDMEVYGVQNCGFQVSYPNCRITQYAMQLTDEGMKAVMAMFYPDLFGLSGEHVIRLYSLPEPEPDDLYGDQQLLESGVRTKGGQLPPLLTFETAASSPMPTPEIPSATPQPIPQVSHGHILSLDKAVHYSMERLGSDDMKKKMYGCILLVGGGFIFPGAAHMLQNYIRSSLPAHCRQFVDRVEVLAKPKDLDPRMVCWKGASILCCLDSAKELWIAREEWHDCGVRILRERCPFIW